MSEKSMKQHVADALSNTNEVKETITNAILKLDRDYNILRDTSEPEFKLDTSIDALRELGINLSDAQFHDLTMINAIGRSAIPKDDVVTIILLVLRLVGVLPAESEASFPMDKVKYL